MHRSARGGTPLWLSVAGSNRGPATTDIKDAQLRGRFDLDALRGLDLNQRPLGYEDTPGRDKCRLSPTNPVRHLQCRPSTLGHVGICWEQFTDRRRTAPRGIADAMSVP